MAAGGEKGMVFDEGLEGGGKADEDEGAEGFRSSDDCTVFAEGLRGDGGVCCIPGGEEGVG